MTFYLCGKEEMGRAGFSVSLDSILTGLKLFGKDWFYTE